MAHDRVALTRQVKEANDIVEVVGTYVALRQVGRKYKGLCPFHDDHHPSFDVDPQFQNFRCWSCEKSGDVFTFIQEHERVDFREALELLARRAGIPLENGPEGAPQRSRAFMLDMVAWGAEQFHQCLLDSPLAEAARHYLGERRLNGETVRRFGLGYAPVPGDWLVQRASKAGLSAEVLEQVGLIGQRSEGKGWYDRFRDRVIFPIRNAQGQTVGFGGRIMPSSPLSARAAKYYNSSETPLFSKSEQLYGLDQARKAGAAAGYLAVVEGYTDVLMAHQLGIGQVVATMGTALNARHVRQLRRFLPQGRVVLVFDADAGGDTGVDRALEVFVSQEMDLAIATLPDGMDPCDLLVQKGPEAFQSILESGVDVLEFKLNRSLAGAGASGIEGRRRAVEAVLGIIAQAPERSGQAGSVKLELVVNRIAHRLGLQEPTVWARLNELRARRRPASRPPEPAPTEKRQGPAPAHERELLQVLLAEPALVPTAAAEVAPGDLEHPGLRQLLEGLYTLQAEGQVPDLDQLRARIDNPRLTEFALKEQEVGRTNPDRGAWLRQLLDQFRQRRLLPGKQELHHQLQAANDHTEAVELLRQLQKQTLGLAPGLSAGTGARP